MIYYTIFMLSILLILLAVLLFKLTKSENLTIEDTKTDEEVKTDKKEDVKTKKEDDKTKCVLTCNNAPNWWYPKKKYNKTDSETKMYLDRQSSELNTEASVYRFWEIIMQY